jgi:hypothetical protein
VQETSPALSGKTLTTGNEPLNVTLGVNEDYTGIEFGYH